MLYSGFELFKIVSLIVFHSYNFVLWYLSLLDFLPLGWNVIESDLLSCRLWHSTLTECTAGLVASNRLLWSCWRHGRQCRPADIICYVLYGSHKWKWLIGSRFVQMRQKPSGNIQLVAVLFQLRTLNDFLLKSGTIGSTEFCTALSSRLFFVWFLVSPGDSLSSAPWLVEACAPTGDLSIFQRRSGHLDTPILCIKPFSASKYR